MRVLEQLVLSEQVPSRILLLVQDMMAYMPLCGALTLSIASGSVVSLTVVATSVDMIAPWSVLFHIQIVFLTKYNHIIGRLVSRD